MMIMKLGQRKIKKKNGKELIEDPMDIDADCNIYGPFLYESYGELLVFRRMSDNFIMKCALCGNSLEISQMDWDLFWQNKEGYN